MVRAALALCGMAGLAACTGAPAPKPLPTPTPAPAPAAAPPLPADWRDLPVAPGAWSYRAITGGTIATFGLPGQPAQLSFGCDLATHRISVARASSLPPERISGQMIVHTSFGRTPWPVVAGTGATGAYATAIRAGNDGAFDSIAFSRGRFAIEAPGAMPIAVPGWAEVSRVIEDCRG